ncbi:MAG: hypothetical protein AAGB22_04770, partial [Bacteroidota bacterium]
MATLDAIVAAIADDFVRQYKYSREETIAYFAEQLAAESSLLALIEHAATQKHVFRNAAFKAFLKRHKKALYYRKRVYRLDDAAVAEQLAALPERDDREAAVAELAALHISSRERLPEQDQFYQKLLPWIAEATSLLDVGCGVQPLLFPFLERPDFQHYAAIDRDATTTAVLQAVKHRYPEVYANLHPTHGQLSAGWAVHPGPYDVAFMLKLLPVIARQEPELFDTLAETPAS